MRTVGEYIKDRIEALGLRASEVARSASVTGEHILYIEKGERKAPSFEVVMKILRASECGSTGISAGDRAYARQCRACSG